MMNKHLLSLGLGLGLSTQAFAQETLDIGILQDRDISVVQKMLYPKTERLEYGLHVGWMPFDTYTTTPMGALTGAYHLSESLGVEVALAGGYGLKNANMKQLEGPAYGIAPDAYRYLTSVGVHAMYSPIYAKLNWLGQKVFHHDFYGLAGGGLTVEQAIMPDATMAYSPTIDLGVGARVFLTSGNAIRIQLRDELVIQKRVKTEDSQSTFLKQNASITVGYVMFGSRK